MPLDPAQPEFHPNTSRDWLNANGLATKNLEIFQVLKKHSYASKEEFVHELKKTIKSQVCASNIHFV